MPQPQRRLHIVDGESTGGTLRVSGLARGKDILRWKDALYEGPVPSGLSLKQLSRLRSRFWTRGKQIAEFHKRDAHLLRWKEYGEIVLWFGSTSLCQLSLAQILSWFKTRKLGNRSLSLVTAYGGTLRPEQLIGPYQARKAVTVRQFELASRFWNAFTAPIPLALQILLARNLQPLPELRSTIEELLQEYPSRYNGLSRFERKLLLAIDGMGSASAVFPVVSVLQQHAIGDTLLFDMLRRLVTAPNPLLTFAQPFKGNIRTYEFNAAKLRLTETGERVLAGEADHVALNGIDRWIGGVHLLGHQPKWRWDERQNKVVRFAR